LSERQLSALATGVLVTGKPIPRAVAVFVAHHIAAKAAATARHNLLKREGNLKLYLVKTGKLLYIWKILMGN
jgi:hypothetical protein